MRDKELRNLQSRIRQHFPAGEQQLVRFRRQYLQKLDLKHITFPPAELLQLYDVQRWIHEFVRDPPADEHRPKSDHNILNELVKRIEDAVKDAEEPDVFDPLVELAAELCMQPRLPALEAVQRDVWVSYEAPGDEDMLRQESIKLLEKPQVLAATGCTGYRTWQAALALATRITAEWLPASKLVGKRVLELGAGTGLLSFVCAKYGEADLVVATDGAQDAVERLKLTSEINGLAKTGKSTYGIYWWGEPFEGTAIGEALDTGRPFDIVLAADVVRTPFPHSKSIDPARFSSLTLQQTYDPASLSSLVKTFSMLLAINPHTLVVVSATFRNQATFNGFLRICSEFYYHT